MERTHFGRYEVQLEIGDGAMGRVFRCFDPLVRRTVAIKTVKSEYLTKETSEEYLERFRREAQSAGSLGHPAIVAVFDVGEDYFVMEFLEGTTLQALIKERGQLAVPEALRILAAVADALDFAHKAGIVHRDIKPANIMVLPDGRPKLMDFGVAHLESSVMTAAGQLLGSPSYMAPEQVLTGEVTNRADLFSFAVVAYETLTGQKPFQGESITGIIYRVVNDPAPPPRQWNAALPAIYDSVFEHALSKSPANRYPTAGALIAALSLKAEVEPALAARLPTPRKDTVVHTAPLPPASAAGGGETASLRSSELETHEIALPAAAATPLQETAPIPRVEIAPARGIPARALLVAGVAVAALLGLWLLRTPEAAAPVASPAPSPSLRPAVADGLRVESQPEGAVVWLDGTEVGHTPLDLAGLKPGTHQVRVASEGYAPAQLGLEISAGTLPPPLRFVMEAVAARVAVVSDPSEAAVRIDGAAAGTTPLARVFLTPGRHEVRVERKGYAPWLQRIEVKADQELSLSARLEKLVIGKPATPEPTPTPTPTPRPLTEGDQVVLDASVTPPRKIAGESASYPELARKMRQFGSVTVELLVDEHGVPSNLRVVESAGMVLDQAVLEAARTWRFEPAQKAGIKVKVLWRIKQTFAPSQP